MNKQNYQAIVNALVAELGTPDEQDGTHALWWDHAVSIEVSGEFWVSGYGTKIADFQEFEVAWNNPHPCI